MAGMTPRAVAVQAAVTAGLTSLAATALAKMIIEEGEPARERYLTMLKSGSNDYPIALLKKAGIDMTSTAPMEATIAVFDDLVDQLEVALDEMNALAVTRH